MILNQMGQAVSHGAPNHPTAWSVCLGALLGQLGAKRLESRLGRSYVLLDTPSEHTITTITYLSACLSKEDCSTASPPVQWRREALVLLPSAHGCGAAMLGTPAESYLSKFWLDAFSVAFLLQYFLGQS